MNIMGRKVRVEYWKKKDGTITVSDNNDTVLDLYEKIVKFLHDETQSSLSFPPGITKDIRAKLHTFCEKLGLMHYSEGVGEDRFLIIKKKEDEKYNDKKVSIKRNKQTTNMTTNVQIFEPIVFKK